MKYNDLHILSYEAEISVNGVEGNFCGVRQDGVALWYSLDDLKVKKIPKRAIIIVHEEEREKVLFNERMKKTSKGVINK